MLRMANKSEFLSWNMDEPASYTITKQQQK